MTTPWLPMDAVLRHARTSALAVASAALLLAGCGNDVPTAPPGSLQIEVFTSGPYPDPDGYTVAISGRGTRQLAIDTSLLLADLGSGTYSITISGLGSNCSLRGSPNREVEVNDGEITLVRIEVDCLTQPEECRFDFDLGASTGATPTFSWNPACRITWLTVIDHDDPDGPSSAVRWTISGPPFASPIVYGIAPAGVTVDKAALPLTPGHATSVRAQFEDGTFPPALVFTP
jgi:hypothetical protein